MTSQAMRACERLARRHYENFTVGSWLLPRAVRRDLRAIYAYCRTVDDLGDESAGDRLALLAAWEEDLDACFAGRPRGIVFEALAGAIARRGLPREPFRKLIEANRMDQRTARHATYADLLRYCDYSANPVGHLVLHAVGAFDARRADLSDAVCTALQLTNFWQDVARDWRKGRIYLPLEDMARFGVPEETVASGRATPAFRSLLAYEVERTRALLRTGAALAREVPAWFRVDLLLFVRGGWGILDKIAALGYDTLSARPAWSRWEKARLVWDTWRRRDLFLERGLDAP